MGHWEEIYLRIHRSYSLNSFLFFCTVTATSGVGGTNMIYTTMKSMSTTKTGQKIANSRRLLILACFKAKSCIIMDSLDTFC